MTRARGAFALVLLTLVTVIAGCAASVTLTPAPHAGDARCAAVMVRLPHDLSGQQRRWTDAQSTAAWGDPTTVIMSCGVTPPAPTTLSCVSLGGVDWIVDDSSYPRLRVTTFGRNPAVQVYLDSTARDIDSNLVLARLGETIAPATSPTGAECSTKAAVPRTAP